MFLLFSHVQTLPPKFGHESSNISSYNNGLWNDKGPNTAKSNYTQYTVFTRIRQVSTFMRIPTQNTFNFTCTYTATLSFSENDWGGGKKNHVLIFG